MKGEGWSWSNHWTFQDRAADGRAGFFSQEVRKMSAQDRKAMLDRADKSLSVRRQCALVSVARSAVYRARKPANDNDGALMRRIDELFTAWPWWRSSTGRRARCLRGGCRTRWTLRFVWR